MDPYITLKYPSLFVIRRVGISTLPAFRQILNAAREFCAASNQPIAIIFDGGASAEGRADAASRQAAAEWLDENDALLRARIAGIDFVISNPLSRGALTAVLWLRSPPFDIKSHSDLQTAVESALSRISSPLSAAKIVEEVETLAREKTRHTGG